MKAVAATQVSPETDNPAATAAANDAAAQAATDEQTIDVPRKPKQGDLIHFHHTHLKSVEARIDRVAPDGTVDLTVFDPREKSFRVTGSKFDETLQSPDSWRFAD